MMSSDVSRGVWRGEKESRTRQREDRDDVLGKNYSVSDVMTSIVHKSSRSLTNNENFSSV